MWLFLILSFMNIVLLVSDVYIYQRSKRLREKTFQYLSTYFALMASHPFVNENPHFVHEQMKKVLPVSWQSFNLLGLLTFHRRFSSVSQLLSVIKDHQEYGGKIDHVLLHIQNDIWQAHELSSKLDTAISGMLIQAMILKALPFIFMGYSILVFPEYARPFFYSFIGAGLLLLLMLVQLLWGFLVNRWRSLLLIHPSQKGLKDFSDVLQHLLVSLEYGTAPQTAENKFFHPLQKLKKIKDSRLGNLIMTFDMIMKISIESGVSSAFSIKQLRNLAEYYIEQERQTQLVRLPMRLTALMMVTLLPLSMLFMLAPFLSRLSF